MWTERINDVRFLAVCARLLCSGFHFLWRIRGCFWPKPITFSNLGLTTDSTYSCRIITVSFWNIYTTQRGRSSTVNSDWSWWRIGLKADLLTVSSEMQSKPRCSSLNDASNTTATNLTSRKTMWLLRGTIVLDTLRLGRNNESEFQAITDVTSTLEYPAPASPWQQLKLQCAKQHKMSRWVCCIHDTFLCFVHSVLLSSIWDPAGKVLSVAVGPQRRTYLTYHKVKKALWCESKLHFRNTSSTAYHPQLY